MPIIRWHDIRPNDIVNPSTNRISLGICCEIQTMSFHGWVDEETDPRFTIMQLDQTYHYERAHDDPDPERTEQWAAHNIQSRDLCTPLLGDTDFAAYAQIPMRFAPPYPRCAFEGRYRWHPSRGREFVIDGRPLASSEMPDSPEDSLSWEDYTLMTCGG